MTTRASKTLDEKEKRIFTYLHTRLVIVSKGLLSGTIITPPSTVSQIVTITKPVVTPTVVPVIKPVTMSGIISLGINFSHPTLMSYDFTKDKRFPKTVNSILDSFTEKIIIQIHSGNPSKKTLDAIYKEVFIALNNKINMSSDIKERKVLQYILNHVYIRQQEEKIAR